MKAQTITTIALVALLTFAISADRVIARASPPAQQPPAQQESGGSGGVSGGGATDSTDGGGSGGGASGGYTKPTYREHSGSTTRVTYRSTTENISDSFVGAVIGILLFAGAHILLFWNEGRTLHRESALDEAKNRVREIDVDGTATGGEGQSLLGAVADGTLVHASGRASAINGEVVEDADIGLVDGHGLPVLKLSRTVKVWQWIEQSSSNTEKNVGGSSRTTTTYSYTKEWRSELLDSSRYQNPPFPANPTQKPLQDSNRAVHSVHFGGGVSAGGYVLSKSQIDSIPCNEPIALPAQVVANAIRRQLGGGAPPVHVNGSVIYLGQNPNEPEIGDVVIEYKAATPQVVSIMAEQRSIGGGTKSFGPCTMGNGQAIDLFAVGTVSAAAMIVNEQNNNAIMKWVLRVLGMLLMWIGCMMTTGPLVAIANIIPFIGSIVGGLTTALSFLLCIPLSILTISIAWIYYRPRVGFMLLAVSLLGFYVVSMRAQSVGAAAKA